MDLLLNIDPEFYGPFVTSDKKYGKVIIVECMNAINGNMVVSLLYYKKFLHTLNSNGFQLNPYDPCVANHIVNDNQQTICFHADNWKISHQDSKVNEEFINTLCYEYESIFEDGYGKMKVNWGKLHKYLGMTLD